MLARIVFGFAGISALVAQDLTVQMDCNNQPVGQVPIQVFDSSNVQVPNLDTTDSDGVFVIVNSETFNAPFYLFFTTPNGSTCGSYPIVQNTPSEGSVYLNYYPTELPCSCSKLLDQ